MTLELFAPECQDNLLPCDGIVQNYGLILNEAQSSQYLRYFLQHLAWQPDEVVLHGAALYYGTQSGVVWR